MTQPNAKTPPRLAASERVPGSPRTRCALVLWIKIGADALPTATNLLAPGSAENFYELFVIDDEGRFDGQEV